MNSQHVIIDCPSCNVRVNGRIAGSVSDEDGSAFVLVACPSCNSALFGSSFLFRDDRDSWVFDKADRLWPMPSLVDVSPSIPEAARRELKDAQRCLSHGIYSAAAVLCGRALERLVAEKSVGSTLAKGLENLRSSGIIDQRLFQWAEALRKERNLGAHASDQEVTRENAQDVVDFSIAIFEYVYALAEKYELYLARKQRPEG